MLARRLVLWFVGFATSSTDRFSNRNKDKQAELAGRIDGIPIAVRRLMNDHIEKERLIQAQEVSRGTVSSEKKRDY